MFLHVFYTGLLSTALLIALDLLLVFLIIGGEINESLLFFAFPAIAGTWLVIVFRHRQFKNLSKQKKIDNYEDNLV